MLENITHFDLQQYWWIIISLIAGILVFLMFVQGGQTLIFTLGKNEIEKKILVNTLGRKWEFTFTTLVTFGGAFFASFPLFYATSFGGAYWVWMAILFCFIIQAIAYEFRSKPSNFLGQKTYEVFLLVNGFFATMLLGTAVATFFTGSSFVLNDMNLSEWTNHWRGLEALTDFRNVSLGIAVFALSRILALQYFRKNIDNESIMNRSQTHLWQNTGIFLLAFLYWLVSLLIREGFAYDPETMVVSMEKYKYLHNILEMPLVGFILLAGIVLVLTGIIGSLITSFPRGIFLSGTGTVLTVFAIFLLAGLNNTAFYPSSYDLQSSLHIQNSSSSMYTLTAMSYVSLIVPFVFAYILYAWKAINNKKMDEMEMESDSHAY